MLGNSYTRISGRVNLDVDLTPWAKFLFSGSISEGRNQRVNMAWSGGLGRAMSQAFPYMPVRYDSDTLVNGVSYEAGDFYQWNTNWNMVAEREMKKWRSTENRHFSNAQLIFKPLQDFHIKFTGGFDRMLIEEDIWEPEAFNNYLDQGNLYSNTILNWNLGATADYRHEIDDTQAITLLVGSEYQRADNFSWDYYFDSTVTFDSLHFILYSNDSLLTQSSTPNLYFKSDSQFNESKSTYLDFEGFTTADWEDLGLPIVNVNTDTSGLFKSTELVWDIDTLIQSLSDTLDSALVRSFAIQLTPNNTNFMELFSEEATTGEKDPKIIMYYRHTSLSGDSTIIYTTSATIYSSGDLSIIDPGSIDTESINLGLSNGIGLRSLVSISFDSASIPEGSLIRKALLTLPIDTSGSSLSLIHI